MKFYHLLILSLLFPYSLSAQLFIGSGAQFSIAGNLQLTLDNTDLINNGSFIPGSSIITFKGNASSNISGNTSTQFFALELNKTNNNSVFLHQSIGVTQRILFSSGYLNLNTFNADLGTTGFLEGENENSRATGTNGGELLFSTVLNAPNAVNPANLGAIITSTQNLGSVIIKRGHQSQIIGNGSSNSLFRYYEVIPTNNTNLNATLRFYYFDAELDTLNENALVFFKSNDSTDWLVQGLTSIDPSTDYVEKTAISSFSEWWTLSNLFSVLPTHFISFNVMCKGNNVVLNWKTAQEQNVNQFTIERSINGIDWKMIGAIPFASTGVNERNYLYTDNNPVENAYYRISEHDKDGKFQYSKTVRSSCAVADEFKVWPNPVQNVVLINIVSRNESKALISLFDSKGALVKTETAYLLTGNNQFKLNVSSLANGVYSLCADWNNGQTKRTMLLIKQ